MKLIKALCAMLALGMAQNSLAGESYGELPWKEFATIEAVNSSELHLDVSGAVGQYIRIENPVLHAATTGTTSVMGGLRVTEFDHVNGAKPVGLVLLPNAHS